MKSQSSFSNPAAAYAKQLIKRNWIIPLLSIAAYLLYVETTFLTSLNRQFFYPDEVESILGFQNFWLFIGTIILGIIIAVMLLRDLHTQESAAFLHALPIKRTTIFMTTIAVGTLMIAVILGVTAICMAGSCHALAHLYPKHEYIVKIQTVFRPSLCGFWFVKAMISTFFTFALALLCGIVTGHTVVHVLLYFYAYIFPWAATAVFDYYRVQSYTGAVSADFDFLTYFPGYTMLNNTYTPSLMVITLLGSLAVLVLGGIIYQRIPLERVPSATLFPALSDFLSYTITLIGMTAFIALFGIGTDIKAHLLGSLLTGLVSSAIIFTVCRMIASSSLQVFHLSQLKKYGLYLLICLCIMLVSVFNIFHLGYQVPSADSIDRIDFIYWHESGGNQMDAQGIDDPEMIKLICKLHQSSLDDIKQKGSHANQDTYGHYHISYHRKGRMMEREYEAGTGQRDILNQIVRKDDSWNQFLDRLDHHCVLSFIKDGVTNEKTINKEDLPGLKDALKKDLSHLTIDSLSEDYLGCDLIAYQKETEHERIQEKSLMLTDSFQETRQYLKQKGYL